MNLAISSSYLVLIAIWSTTALSIKWGVTGVPFTFALMLRFVMAAALGALILRWKVGKLPRDPAHLRAYLIAGTATSLSMLCSFWAAQYIASGLIAVLYGLTPLVTGILAARWLASPLLRSEWCAIVVGLIGLAMIFGNNLSFSPSGIPGMGAILLGMALQAAAAVLLKRHTQQQSPLAVNSGALIVCAILCSSFWLLSGAPWPAHIPYQALAALIYLALIGSVVAFSLYYWLIQQCKPLNVALISLITPISSLLLGHWLNQEILYRHELIGTGLILLGLIIHTRLRKH
ncbi:EamA family transporter [Chitinibacter sp. SCUT-21]|uniref:DMT family transporter n=1 Tax=Chitinibacter sp. SCUT-21 TaxID=2970891 RepID=UPI0035A6F5C5